VTYLASNAIEFGKKRKIRVITPLKVIKVIEVGPVILVNLYYTVIL